MSTLKVGLAQIYPRLGDLEANLEKHLEFIEEAAARGADLVVFPELSLTGYVLQDLTYEVAIRPEPDHPILRPLLDASRRVDLVVGFVEIDERGRYYTAGAYLSGGQMVHRHRKVYLPTYGMFDEGRDMASQRLEPKRRTVSPSRKARSACGGSARRAQPTRSIPCTASSSAWASASERPASHP
jgi:predicted amidohydrolase